MRVIQSKVSKCLIITATLCILIFRGNSSMGQLELKYLTESQCHIGKVRQKALY